MGNRGMENQYSNKEYIPHLVNWQLAYAARELRHNKSVTLNCSSSETDHIIKQISSFSNYGRIKTKAYKKPDSGEVLLEIMDIQ